MSENNFKQFETTDEAHASVFNEKVVQPGEDLRQDYSSHKADYAHYPVEQPSSFSGSPDDEEVHLSWTNPPNREVKDEQDNIFTLAELGEMEVKRDGGVIYTGIDETYTDTGLTNDQEYTYEIVSITTAGVRSEPVIITVTPVPFTMDWEYGATDVEVTGATEDGGQAILEWTNPTEGDLAGMLIRRGDVSHPTSIDEGTLVYDGLDETVTDTGLTNDQTYYYTFWAYNTSNQYSDNANKVEVSVEVMLGQDPTGSPGSAVLVQGDTTAGWFGEVTTAEFGADHREIDTLLGLSVGNTQNDTEPFLKFIHDGKIKFIPKKSTRNDLSWDDINIALGGSAEDAPAEKVITVGDFQYKVRFMRGAGRVEEQANGELYTDSFDDDDRASIWEGVNGDWNANSESEWNTLILPVHTDSDGGGSNKDNFSHPDYAPDNVPDWASYTDEQLNVVGDGRAVWCAETRDTDTSRRVVRGDSVSSVLGSYSSSGSYSFAGLRLVFELL